MLTAGAGYVINDIYDRNIDKLNKPHLVIINRYVSVRSAENFYVVINLLAIAIGVYVSYKNNLRSLSLLFPIVAGILYFYSNTYKSIFLFGNILVSVLSAMIPFTVILFDLPLLYQKFKSFIGLSDFNFNLIIYSFSIYAGFAFLISLFREIIKDIEDFEGDNAMGKNTLPVAYGTSTSRVISLIILGILILGVFFIMLKYLHDPISMAYILGFILAPIIYIFVLLIKAKEVKDFAQISKISKIIMLLGISYTLVFGQFILK
jgi:4-hydroxybenzoate polyprenyltransferase